MVTDNKNKDICAEPNRRLPINTGVGIKDIAQIDDSIVEAVKYRNRRRWTRYTVDIDVRVLLTTNGATRTRTFPYDGHGINLNRGGLAVLADINIPIGTQIKVSFTLPHFEQPMTLRCFVRNRVGNRYGVEFITENEEDYRKTAELEELLAAKQGHY